MEIGCGARVLDFGGRRYVYFWQYERQGGRSVRREDSVGRFGAPKTKGALLRRMAAYHRRAEQEIARRWARIERFVSAAVHTSTWRYPAHSTSRAAIASRVRALCPVAVR